jgi:hypothetical protein
VVKQQTPQARKKIQFAKFPVNDKILLIAPPDTISHQTIMGTAKSLLP